MPNVFRVHLAPSDVERIDAWGHDEMVRQMAEVVTSHAAEQGYSFVGPVEVSFLPDQALSAPAIEIDSS
ncbi:FhaA domain-containing protein, partial [Actinomyces sp. 186855]|uniref:FhaA domain-containing protein n=1 Tax=Actinomyces sp. 186855 TaxID=2761164 RepID=UPI00202FAF6A